MPFMAKMRKFLLIGLMMVLFLAMLWFLTGREGIDAGYTGFAPLDGNANDGPVKLSQYLPEIIFIGAVILAMFYLDKA